MGVGSRLPIRVHARSGLLNERARGTQPAVFPHWKNRDVPPIVVRHQKEPAGSVQEKVRRRRAQRRHLLDKF